MSETGHVEAARVGRTRTSPVHALYPDRGHAPGWCLEFPYQPKLILLFC